MRALDAVVRVMGPGGVRRISIADFHRLPGDTPEIETELQPGEMITAVELPAPLGGTHVYRKVRERASYAFATVSVALVARVDGESVGIERLAFGGLAAKPWRVEAAERRGTGTPKEVARDAANIALEGATPTHENAYKIARGAVTARGTNRCNGADSMSRLDTLNTDTRIVGQPMRRIDGPLKVSGTATYAYENARLGEALVGVFAISTIGKGR